MTDKEFLVLQVDMSARVPYGLKALYGGLAIIDVEGVNYYGEVTPRGCNYTVPLEEVKPYLRQLSSMTDEEKKEWFKYSHVDYDCEFKPDATLSVYDCHLSIDWLNEHHFDYRGLIEKGLVLEATEDMYKD
jgi:hypothetical protein